MNDESGYLNKRGRRVIEGILRGRSPQRIDQDPYIPRDVGPDLAADYECARELISRFIRDSKIQLQSFDVRVAGVIQSVQSSPGIKLDADEECVRSAVRMGLVYQAANGQLFPGLLSIGLRPDRLNHLRVNSNADLTKSVASYVTIHQPVSLGEMRRRFGGRKRYVDKLGWLLAHEILQEVQLPGAKRRPQTFLIANGLNSLVRILRWRIMTYHFVYRDTHETTSSQMAMLAPDLDPELIAKQLKVLSKHGCLSCERRRFVGQEFAVRWDAKEHLAAWERHLKVLRLESYCAERMETDHWEERILAFLRENGPSYKNDIRKSLGRKAVGYLPVLIEGLTLQATEEVWHPEFKGRAATIIHLPGQVPELDDVGRLKR